METKEQNPKELILKQFDKLYTMAEDILWNWKAKIIPENTLKKILELSKIDTSKTESEEVKKALDQYNLILDNILKESKALFLNFDKTGLPLAVFKQLIERVKESFAEGYDNAKNEQI
jgi:hypothetical protein